MTLPQFELIEFMPDSSSQSPATAAATTATGVAAGGDQGLDLFRVQLVRACLELGEFLGALRRERELRRAQLSRRRP